MHRYNVSALLDAARQPNQNTKCWAHKTDLTLRCAVHRHDTISLHV
jgi:hypothetical protein